MDGQPPFVDPVMFESITGSTIANSALQTKGSSGPSGLDADGWRRILVSKNFGAAGHNLRAYAHQWPFILGTVTVYPLVYLRSAELKPHHQKRLHRVIPLQCQFMQ